MNIKRLSSLILVAILGLSACQMPGGKSDATSAVQIDRDVDTALKNLYDRTPAARKLGKTAKAILVFPGIVKAGFIGGAQYGKGALIKNGRTAGYYNMVAGSYGLQAGVQTFDYAMFFMTNSALGAPFVKRRLVSSSARPSPVPATILIPWGVHFSESFSICCCIARASELSSCCVATCGCRTCC